MIRYPMSNRDAMRSYMRRVPAAGVTFVDPVLDMFFADEANGLCTIELDRKMGYADEVEPQHSVRVTYTDPELEVVKRLSI